MSYIERTQELESLSSYRRLRSAWEQLAWLTVTWPDIAVSTNKLSQIMEKTFESTHVKQFNKIVRHFKATTDQVFLMQKLGFDSLSVRVFSNASFTSSRDFTSQLGFIVLLFDKHHRANVLHFNSYKSMRITRSVLGNEIHEFADAFDYDSLWNMICNALYTRIYLLWWWLTPRVCSIFGLRIQKQQNSA